MKEIAAILSGQIKPSTLKSTQKIESQTNSFIEVARGLVIDPGQAVVDKGLLWEMSFKRKDEKLVDLFDPEEEQEEVLNSLLKRLQNKLDNLFSD
ncbi:hypothetical protein A2291_08055 [candidate division WOR-1 bacterium RIFOXYB2_FULL_42_35]|uniref:Uncharacterized protein n=1 Tax=candidate division WOR-1 bacterium RIFOXYC2_FULL_41_25 TaxID=1802586 RepID=A0A1F4TK90_UNCSA|nr:MAG: hypothetical protein A2247_01985 [candidate division WOR-1 bacterium RIFOXYA2_FULL_41_14]OGC24040.1 MAG: hypothetical protein A2291_08055 [candidate division WOR-1 bacterium RIFOXYB2_FULL_42_35]OGC32463.1 MAG: hypothetical protein A2462_00155 [candidate division WOR-1 bacterium RIFOXYC2_FULL_41_25]OGC44002.1 MAG: hypothetical protein A2548_00185 [candidate division WOR-1 bacterium RIFOXYD2_FULL_41_8]